ncbi:unnamed protein product, partial [Oppiella nova]
EICAYFYSYSLIKTYGHTKVLCIGLAGNVARFLYISWLTNPWWVLPFELIQGVTHATVWAAACSYITQHTEPQLRSSTQGVLQGLHHGLGRGCGSIIGGMFVNRWGTQITFRLYGVLSIVVLGAFIHVNYYKPKEGYKFYEEDTDQVVMDSASALAPHGVPTNPINRSHSRSNIQQQSPDQPESKGDANNGTNPFKSDDPYLDPNHAWNQTYQNSVKLGNHFNLVSPEGNWDLSAIRKHFKMLNEMQIYNNYNEWAVSDLIKNIKTETYQPIIECDSTYDW